MGQRYLREVGTVIDMLILNTYNVAWFGESCVFNTLQSGYAVADYYAVVSINRWFIYAVLER
jgi:hypothetical protein